jgi:hypothetical protein
VKELRIKKHEKPKDAIAGARGDARTKAVGGEDLDSGDVDFVPKKKGWWGKLESKLKQVLCF